MDALKIRLTGKRRRQLPLPHWTAMSGIACILQFGVPVSAVAQSPPQGAQNVVELRARGVVRPANQATISSDLNARVSKIHFKEGEAFRQGDVLIEFDCRRYRAEFNAADAGRREMQLGVKSNRYLARHRAVGKQEVQISKARLDKASAEAEALAVRLDQCKVIAPFAGRVAELGIHEHETSTAQKPFISIIDDRRLEVELIVPSSWLRWLRKQAVFGFAVDETGGEFRARVSRISASVDAVSQTIKVMAVFDDVDGRVLAGMSGVAKFKQPAG